MKQYRFALMLLAISPSIATAQTPSPTVSLGFGVDTAITDVHNIVSLVRAYLAKPDSSARTNGVWTTSTDFDRKYGDIIRWQANQGFPATIVGIIPFTPGDSVYTVKILYARYDSTDGIAPLSFERLLAVRESGAPFGFRLAGLFPRASKQWESRARGPLTFWYALVVNAVYRRQGITGLRRLYQVRGDGDTIARAIADSLGLPASDPDALDKWWRLEPKRVQNASPPSGGGERHSVIKL